MAPVLASFRDNRRYDTPVNGGPPPTLELGHTQLRGRDADFTGEVPAADQEEAQGCPPR